MLRGENLGFSWGKGWIFKDVYFSLHPGESFFIQGPNGCGKTTFLKVCATLLLPSQGQLFFQKKKLDLFDEIFKQESIFLGHTLGIRKEATVQEFLDLFQISLAAFSYFGQEKWGTKSIGELSYGQQRRLILSRWVESFKRGKNTAIWIGDECFSGLDIRGYTLLLSLIQKHLAKGGIFLASHHGDLPFKPTYHFIWEEKEEDLEEQIL